jgi:hypothetical protein
MMTFIPILIYDISDVVLMDANYTVNEELGQCEIPLDDIKLEQEVERPANFKNVSIRSRYILSILILELNVASNTNAEK